MFFIPLQYGVMPDVSGGLIPNNSSGLRFFGVRYFWVKSSNNKLVVFVGVVVGVVSVVVVVSDVVVVVKPLEELVSLREQIHST